MAKIATSANFCHVTAASARRNREKENYMEMYLPHQQRQQCVIRVIREEKKTDVCATDV
jgi:hypothetical protein